jgi:coenzyme F420-reducing hydrogenase alpha subunit
MDVDSFFPELKVDIQIKMEDLISILNELVKSTSDIKLDYDEYITREKRGFLFFKKTVYNIRDLDSLIVDIIYAIKKHTYQVFSALEGNIENTLAKLKNKLDEQIKEIDAFAREQLELARNHIEEDSKRAKAALVELAGFTQVFQEVTNVWDNLIKPIQLGT